MRFAFALPMLALFVLLLLFSGCASQGGGASGNAPAQTTGYGGGNSGTTALPGVALAKETPAGLSVSDPELRKIYDAALVAAPALTTLDNIEAAYQSQGISKEEYLVLSLQAIYSPSSLPQQYAGAEMGRYDPTSEKMQAIEAWETLTPEAQEKIRGYLFQSEDEAKADAAGGVNLDWQKQNVLFGNGHKPVSLDAPPAGNLVLYKLDAITGKATIKGYLPPTATNAQKDVLEAKMQWVKDGVLDSWSRFYTLLGIQPTEAVHITIKTNMGGTAIGTAVMSTEQSDPVSRCRIELSSQEMTLAGESKSKSAVAHELFHCFQYYVPLRDYSLPDEAWLHEATATWAEDYIYPRTNTEQDYLETFYKTREKTMFAAVPKLKKYGDYSFFQYLQQTGSPSNIRNVLLDAKGGAKGAMKAIPDYENKFADYAFWNWNMAPFKFYSDTPSYPDHSPSGAAVIYNQLSTENRFQQAVSIDSGAAAYYVYDAMLPQSSKKLEFIFSDNGDTAHQRRALIKVGGQWRDEDWTYLGNRRFCLDRQGENVEAVVIIYSNANLDAPYFSQYDVNTKGECPKEITGTTVMETSVTAPIAGGEYKITSKFVSRDVLQYDPENDVYLLKSRTVSCTSSSNAAGAGTDTYLGAPYLASLAAQGDCSGSATFNYQDIPSAPEKIRFDREAGTVYVDLDPSISAPNANYIRCITDQNWGFGDVHLILKQVEKSGTCPSLGPPSLVDWSSLAESEVLRNGRLHKEESQSMPVEGGTTTMKIVVDYSLKEG